jgi:hypothetical protein
MPTARRITTKKINTNPGLTGLAPTGMTSRRQDIAANTGSGDGPQLCGRWDLVTHVGGGVQTCHMPDLSVVSTLISTVGALFGALGGVTLTNRTSARREEAQFRHEEARFSRQRQDQQAEARRRAHHELLSSAAQLRTETEIAGKRHWNDMNVRLASIQQLAVAAGQHASWVGLLSPEMADVARNLASAASRLAATAVECTVMGSSQNDQQLSGEMTRPIDFAEFDEHVERFSRAAAQNNRE